MNDGVSTIDDSSVAVSWEDSSVERSVARDDAAPSVVEEEEVDEAVLTSIYEFAGLDQSSSPAWLHDFLAARLLAEEDEPEPVIEPFVEIERLPQSLGGLSGGSAAPLPRCLLAEPRSSPPRRPGVMDRDARVAAARPNVRAFITFDGNGEILSSMPPHLAKAESAACSAVQLIAAVRDQRVRHEQIRQRQVESCVAACGFGSRPVSSSARWIPSKPEHALELLPPEANTAEASGRRPRPRPSRVGFQSPHQTSDEASDPGHQKIDKIDAPRPRSPARMALRARRVAERARAAAEASRFGTERWSEPASAEADARGSAAAAPRFGAPALLLHHNVKHSCKVQAMVQAHPLFR